MSVKIIQNFFIISYIYYYKTVRLFDLLNAYSITAIHPDYRCRITAVSLIQGIE
jgi:hypothetical protein